MTEPEAAHDTIKIPEDLQAEMLDLSLDIQGHSEQFEKASKVRLEHQNAIKAAHARIDEILNMVRREPLMNQKDEDTPLLEGAGEPFAHADDAIAAPMDAEHFDLAELAWSQMEEIAGDHWFAPSVLHDEDGSAPYVYKVDPTTDETNMFTICNSAESLIKGADRLSFSTLAQAKHACESIEYGIQNATEDEGNAT